MIETYSKNVTVPSQTAIPLNTVAIHKGCTVTKSGTSAIQLQKAGVYEVAVSAVAKLQSLATTTTPTTADDSNTTATALCNDSNVIAIQLAKDNVLQPNAYSAVTASNTTALHPLNFVTLVQVPTNNSSCCCSSPVTIDIINECAAAIYDTVDVVVTKIC